MQEKKRNINLHTKVGLSPETANCFLNKKTKGSGKLINNQRFLPDIF